MPGSGEGVLDEEMQVTLRAFGERLAHVRTTAGFQIEDLAGRLMLSPAQLRALENGDTRPFYNLIFFGQALGRYSSHLGVDPPDIDLGGRHVR
jgi:cytoskeletal protein RodZ